MKKNAKRLISLLMAGMMLTASPVTAVAGETVQGTITVDENNDDVEIKADDKPYLALGADLTEEQRNTVLSLMGIDPANLASYDVVYVTNAEEHQYLDAYIDSSQIGNKSLSSVVIVEREKGSGINISCHICHHDIDVYLFGKSYSLIYSDSFLKAFCPWFFGTFCKDLHCIVPLRGFFPLHNSVFNRL